MSELQVRSEEEEATPAPPRNRYVQWARDLGMLVGGAGVVWFGLGWWRAPALPEIAPDFTLASLTGERVALSSFHGQTVVLNFWATWCGPCKMEMPTLVEFTKNHPDIPVLFVAVDGKAEALSAYARTMGLPPERVLMMDNPTKSVYEISTLPTTVVVRSDGSVGSTHGGVLVGPQLWWMAVVRGG